MQSAAALPVQSEWMAEFAHALPAGTGGRAPVRERPATALRLELDPDKVKNGLAQLVLALVELLHELLERQAIRRIDAGSLTEEEIERVGLTLMRQAEQIERLREEFGLAPEDLNLDLGPLGKLF